MNIKNIASLFLAGMSLISCGDFLEPKSETEYTPKTVEGLNEMLLGEAYPSYDNNRYWMFTGYLDDDLTVRPWMETETDMPGVSYYKDYGSVMEAKVFYTWQKDFYDLFYVSGPLTDIYCSVYKLITGANAALDYADELSASNENDRLNVKAQAYALRAFHYLYLTNIYGTPCNSHPDGLGVPLKLTSKVEKNPLARKTVKECYGRIVGDLLAAEECYVKMGDAHQWKNNYRTSLPMVRLMLSRAYLYMENWSEAARYAKMVMDSGTFSLYDLNDYSVPTKTLPSKAIPEVLYVNFISYDSPETIWLFGSINDGFVTLSILRSPDSQSYTNPTLFNASKELVGSYAEKTVPGGDLRLDHYLVSELAANNDAELSIKRPYGKIAISPYTKGRTPSQPGGGYATVSGRALRLSEAYLNYAEAMAMMAGAEERYGGASLALSALNELREHRIRRADYTALTESDFPAPGDLVKFVRNERRRELCFEGHRWFDLRRWGMPEIIHTWEEEQGKIETYVLPAGDPFYAIPLPRTVLENNPALDPDTWKK